MSMSLVDIFSIKSLIIILMVIGVLNLIYPIIKYYKSYKRYSKLKFSIYISILFFLSFVVLYFLGINLIYLLIYSLLFLVTLVFVGLVRNIKTKCRGNGTISEFRFFIYMLSFGFILFFYIEVFSIFYLNANPLIEGSIGFLSKGNEIKILDRLESFYFSGYVFFSMDYDDIGAQQYLRLIVILELFVAQILIIIFIGILASILLDKLALRNG